MKAHPNNGYRAATLILCALLPVSTAFTRDSPDTRGYLYGRVTTTDDKIYQGRLRFGGDEEAFWNHYFNSKKTNNPWVSHVPPEALKEAHPVSLAGIELGWYETQKDMSRPFMVRFGDIARIEANGRDLRVGLKSGTEVALDRYEADDLADGLRIWDQKQGIVDLSEWRIRSIEFLPTRALTDVPNRLHGTVQTANREFSGFLQWDREASLVADQLIGSKKAVKFADINTIVRNPGNGVTVTLRDGHELNLRGTRATGKGHLGVYVEDSRYGRVLVPWNAFQKLKLSHNVSGPNATGPGYDAFPPGQPLRGTVNLDDGRTLTGRIVFDLDESETVETLDAPYEGVNYTIPFALIDSLRRGDMTTGAKDLFVLTLRSGATLSLEQAGDLRKEHGGLLFLPGHGQPPEYLAWEHIQRIDFENSDGSSG